jgi:hypothetical protein
VTDKEIEQKLSLWAARQPKTEAAQLMLEAAEEIVRLRAALRYEKARADVNNHKEELDRVYQLLAAKGLMDDV